MASRSRGRRGRNQQQLPSPRRKGRAPPATKKERSSGRNPAGNSPLSARRGRLPPRRARPAGKGAPPASRPARTATAQTAPAVIWSSGHRGYLGCRSGGTCRTAPGHHRHHSLLLLLLLPARPARPGPARPRARDAPPPLSGREGAQRLPGPPAGPGRGLRAAG